MSRRFLLLVLVVLFPLAGCDQLGLEAASVTAARLEADGKAVGAACRHGGRAIEDCFALNRKVDKAAIYAGWREMDDYMRENKLEAVVPTLGPGGKPKPAEASVASGSSAPSAVAVADSQAAQDKPADKTGRSLPNRDDKIDRIDKPAMNKAAADKRTADKAAPDPSAADTSAAGRSAAGKAAGGKPIDAKLAAEKSAPR